MKSEETIKRELRRVKKELKTGFPSNVEAELYGAQQALEWALGHDAMAPTKSALLSLPAGK